MVGDHTPAFLFDLDGTLIDSVYQHVLAWHEALEQVGLSLAVWRIHRRIGMSGGLLLQALGREVGEKITPERAKELQEKHALALARYRPSIQPLPGAYDLLKCLSQAKVPFAIATSGRPERSDPALKALGTALKFRSLHERRSSVQNQIQTCFWLPRRV
jgi:beta-phosphoglucomutase-like phosphatase (HAD superfamily)